MASLDRYRPAREGYQPPTATGGAAKPERSSRSPPRRKDIPPAVPTPPQHSSRTSPPRSSTRSGPQSRVMSREQTPLPGLSQWFFTTEEVQSTPSIVEGVPPSEERLRRAKGVNFIYQAGVMLDLPQITLWVAGVLFHRFFMRYSMEPGKGGIHHYVSCYDFATWRHCTDLCRTSLPRPSSLRTRSRRTAERRKTSSSQSPRSHKRTRSCSSTSKIRSTGAGGIRS